MLVVFYIKPDDIERLGNSYLKDLVASFALIAHRNLVWKEMTRADGRVRADTAFSPFEMTKKPPPSVTEKLLHVTRKRRLSCVIHREFSNRQISPAILKRIINFKPWSAIDSLLQSYRIYVHKFFYYKVNLRLDEVEYFRFSIKVQKY